ncbi:MAG: glycosyltransferase [Planctomycetes bacterium]|nr:glycosyltransferase [Planctomycetota bacterium]
MTIVVPLYREADAVAALAAALRAFVADCARPVDVVLVDDGSDDDTAARLAGALPLDRPPFRLIRHDRNRGLSAALRTGSEAATGALIGWLDADLTYPVDVLAPLADAVEPGGADLALASCHHPKGGIEGVPPWRRWLSRRASTLHRLASGARLCTFTCMVRVQRRELLAATWPTRGGFVGVAEQLHRAIALGARIAEVPAVLHRRRTGRSKIRVGRAARGHLALALDAWRGRLR